MSASHTVAYQLTPSIPVLSASELVNQDIYVFVYHLLHTLLCDAVKLVDWGAGSTLFFA